MSEKQSRGRGRGIKPGGFADRLAKATADPEGNPADDDRQAMALKSESERKSRIACRAQGPRSRRRKPRVDSRVIPSSVPPSLLRLDRACFG